MGTEHTVELLRLPPPYTTFDPPQTIASYCTDAIQPLYCHIVARDDNSLASLGSAPIQTLRGCRGDNLRIDRHLRGFVHVNGLSENFVLLQEIRVEELGAVERLPGK